MTRYTPQWNGVAECKNKTIINMARSMLNLRNMYYDLGGEEVACVIALFNNYTTKSVKNIVP